MEYNIKGTGLAVTPEIRAYVEKRLGSLERFVIGDARAEVEVEYRASEEKEYRAEFMLHGPQFPAPLRAEAHGATLHEAIDAANSELFRELTQYKKKHQTVLRRSAVKMKEFLRGWRRDV